VLLAPEEIEEGTANLGGGHGIGRMNDELRMMKGERGRCDGYLGNQKEADGINDSTEHRVRVLLFTTRPLR